MRTKQKLNTAESIRSGNLPETPDFRLRLQNEFLQRCRINRRYSLRAFSKFLRTDPSTISQILRGKRRLTQAHVFHFGAQLGIDPLELETYLKRIERKKQRNQTALELQEPRDLTLDMFQMIADWYHYAIFELITTSDFRSDVRWIAKALGISATEASCAIERLIRLGLIVISEDGSWKQGSELITTVGNPFTAAAFRRLQSQVLNMAIQSLEEVPMDQRDQSSMTMAINSKRLPEARDRIKRFRRELCSFLQQDSARDAVYQLGVSLYPLTKVKNQEKGRKVV